MRVASAGIGLLVTFAFLTSGCLLGGGVEPKDYLKDSKYTEWIIEVDYASGHKPSDAVISLLKTRLIDVVNKPDGITVILDDVLPSGGTWSPSKLRGLSADHKDHKTGGDQVVTHVLVVGGKSSEDTSQGSVLGMAINYDLVVIFDENIQEAAAGCPVPVLCADQVDTVRRAVWVHEFGHALGLVNRGTPMVNNHEDPDHPKHSDNRNSVMYWAVESSAVFSVLTGGPPTTFDADDKADLKAAGGK